MFRIRLNTHLKLWFRFTSKPRFGKKLRKILRLKNLPKRGKSARHGNRPSPYTKYHKVPYHYTGKIQQYSPAPTLVVDNSWKDYVKPSREQRAKKTG